MLRYTPMNLLFVPPTICGEIGTNINGIVVNHDTAVYQERLTLLGWLGVFRFLERRIASEGTVRILEIGGGYGALARQIKRIMPNVSYTICDLPASLYVLSAYLSVACPDLATHVVSEEEPGTEAIEAFHFLPNYALPVFARDYRFDLVINTLSLAEMTAEQVSRYGELVARMISGSGMFFEQNRDNTPVGGVNCKELLQRHFLRRNHLPLPPFSALQGRIDVWSHRAFELPFS